MRRISWRTLMFLLQDNYELSTMLGNHDLIPAYADSWVDFWLTGDIKQTGFKNKGVTCPRWFLGVLGATCVRN